MMLLNYITPPALQPRTFNKVLSAVGLVALLLLSPGIAQAQTIVDTKIGKGLQYMAADTSFYVKLNARFQTLYAGAYS